MNDEYVHFYVYKLLNRPTQVRSRLAQKIRIRPNPVHNTADKTFKFPRYEQFLTDLAVWDFINRNAGLRIENPAFSRTDQVK